MADLRGLGLLRKCLVYIKSKRNSFAHLLFGSFSPEMQIIKGGYVPRGQSKKVCFNHNVLEV